MLFTTWSLDLAYKLCKCGTARLVWASAAGAALRLLRWLPQWPQAVGEKEMKEAQLYLPLLWVLWMKPNWRLEVTTQRCHRQGCGGWGREGGRRCADWSCASYICERMCLINNDDYILYFRIFVLIRITYLYPTLQGMRVGIMVLYIYYIKISNTYY